MCRLKILAKRVKKYLFNTIFALQPALVILVFHSITNMTPAECQLEELRSEMIRVQNTGNDLTYSKLVLLCMTKAFMLSTRDVTPMLIIAG